MKFGWLTILLVLAACDSPSNPGGGPGPGPSRGWSEIVTSQGRTCARRADGRTFCLYKGATVLDSVRIPPLPGVAQLPLALVDLDPYTCGRTAAGELHCWDAQNGPLFGSPFEFQAKRFRKTSGTGIAGCGLDLAGDLLCWNRHSPVHTEGPTLLIPVTGAPELVDLSYESYYACGLSTVGQAYCWSTHQSEGGFLGTGPRQNRQTAAPISTDQRFLRIAVASTHACAITREGEAWCWGNNEGGALGIPRASSGSGCVYVVRDRGQPVSYCETPQRVSGGHRFKQVSTGLGYTCGLTIQGEALCWGLNWGKALGVPTDTPGLEACNAGAFYGCSFSPVAVSGGHVFASLGETGHGTHTCALTREGVGYCWGSVTPQGFPTDTYLGGEALPVQIPGPPGSGGA